jgi:hypothetical protein
MSRVRGKASHTEGGNDELDPPGGLNGREASGVILVAG